MEEPESKKTIHWDGTITAGNVLTAATMLMAVLAMWFRLESRVDMHDNRIGKLEDQGIEMTRQTATGRETTAAMKATLEALLESQRRVERKLEGIEQAYRRGQ